VTYNCWKRYNPLSFAKALKTRMDNNRDLPADEQLQNSSINFEPESQPPVSWVRRHGILIVAMTAAFAYFMTQYNALSIVLVVVGISLLIFVHELGHFLVAKLCNVHVLTFSIGFGPPIPGCKVRWGETTYKLGIIPLGGYVKMVGEGADEKDDDDPRSFKNKSVGQRMAIISAGVTMNVIFAFACFVFVYMTHGENRRPAIIDSVEPGSPAWQNGLRSGDVVRQIGSKKDPYFDDFTFTVMNSLEGEKLDLTVERQNGAESELLTFQIEPRRIEQDIKPIVGVRFPHKLQLPSNPDKDGPRLPVRFNSAAASADPPFEFGDQIIGTTDPTGSDNLENIVPLPSDPRCPDVPDQRDYFEFQKRLRQLNGMEMVIQVRRKNSSQIDNIKVGADNRWVIPGLRMQMGEIVALRHDGPAAMAGIRDGDVIQQVEVKDSRGRPLCYSEHPDNLAPNATCKPLDPDRLPYDLAKWAAEGKDSTVVLLTIRRGNEILKFTLPWDDSWRFNDESTLWGRWSVSISGLGIAYQINTTVAAVESGSPARSKGIRPNDVVKACQFQILGKKPADKPKPDIWVKLKPDEWSLVWTNCQRTEVREVTLRLERDNLEIPLHLEQDKDWPVDDRGLILVEDWRLRKADNLAEAVTIGSKRTVDFMVGIYGNLRALATGRVSADGLTGPLGLAEAAYLLADQDFFQYVIFLGIISLNLAIVNFLPIPVLDGGHMAFLVYEKLMSRPAPKPLRIATTYLGLAIILCLMAFVIYLDLKKKFVAS